MKNLCTSRQFFSRSIDIYFLRHGQSIYQCQRLVAGDNEYGLSGLGKIQTHKIARNLRNVYFDCILTSDLKRTIQTWNIIKQYLRTQPLKNQILFTNLLREKDQGVLKNKPLSELKPYDQDRLYRFERGENWEDVQLRMTRLICGLMAHYLPDECHQQVLNWENDPNVNNENYQLFKSTLPKPSHEKPHYRVLLLTHYGFIREFFYLLRANPNEIDKNIDPNPGYYAQNATLFQVLLTGDQSGGLKFDIIAMNSRLDQHRPFYLSSDDEFNYQNKNFIKQN